MARWKASGVSGTVFAERHGLKRSSLYEWGRKVEEASETAFTEVRVDATSGLASSGGETGIEIETKSGRVVRVRGEVDVEQLRRVLEAVEQC